MNRYIVTSAFLVVVMGICSSCTTAKILGGPVPADRLIDGVYRGSAKDGPVKVVVDVTLTDQRITEIKLVKHRTWKGGGAEETVPHLIIKQQSTKVDAVTGATVSSCAIMNAVQKAVEKATK